MNKHQLTKLLEDSEDPKKYVQVTTVKEYFKLPKNQRERWGFWYLKPKALPAGGMFSEEEEEEEPGWSTWTKQIRKEYPIQGWICEWLLTYDNPVYAFFGVKKRQIKDIWYGIKCFLKPCHQRIRRAIPRRWSDIQYLIINLNLACIEDFYQESEDERCMVDWNSDEEHRVFKKWLNEAHYYITVERNALQKKLDESYPDEETYKKAKKEDWPLEKLYKDVNYYDELIKKTDEKYITEALKHRRMMWT